MAKEKKISAEENRRLNEQFGDIEYLIEMQNKAPEDLRYGGLYGLLSFLGLTGQEPDPELRDSEAYPDKAVIKHMGMSYPYDDSQSYAGATGEYYLPDSDSEAIKKLVRLKTKTRIDEEYDPDFKGPDYYQKSYPQPDEIRIFQSNIPWVRNKFGNIAAKKKGPGGIGGIDDLPKYLQHELSHRATSLSFMQDLLTSLDPDSEEYETLEKLIKDDHYYLNALDEKYGSSPGDKMMQKMYPEGTFDTQKKLRKLRTVQDTIREYLTPERQEELGVRLPIPASKPKGTFEKLYDQITDVF